MRVSPSDDEDVPLTDIRRGPDPSALAAADTEGADTEAAAASEDSDGGTSGDEDAAPARGDTVFGYEPNPADGIVAILNPHATLPEALLPLHHFVHMDADASALWPTQAPQVRGGSVDSALHAPDLA